MVFNSTFLSFLDNGNGFLNLDRPQSLNSVQDIIEEENSIQSSSNKENEKGEETEEIEESSAEVPTSDVEDSNDPILPKTCEEKDLQVIQ